MPVVSWKSDDAGKSGLRVPWMAEIRGSSVYVFPSYWSNLTTKLDFIFDVWRTSRKIWIPWKENRNQQIWHVTMKRSGHKKCVVFTTSCLVPCFLRHWPCRALWFVRRWPVWFLVATGTGLIQMWCYWMYPNAWKWPYRLPNFSKHDPAVFSGMNRLVKLELVVIQWTFHIILIEIEPLIALMKLEIH